MWHLLSGVNGQRAACGWQPNTSASTSIRRIGMCSRFREPTISAAPGRKRLRQLGIGGRLDRLRLNAGFIEAAVLSGFQAANALLGRGRRYRIRGFYMP